ncbi:hypothetical protein IWW39_002219 [Coemansia spiralis]|uniref:Uncharacterized protein n=1 Tax=Coemansia spiralis TaxID=417178 RepID=A0A9W8GKX7_9FUNG|nr:hypothetical protein IWW39_002219 [Coemansia spiralis]
MANINGDRDLAYIFRLRSFSIRVKDIFQAYNATSIGKTLSRVFSTASPGIRSLTLSMNLSADSRLKFMIPPSFVDSLDCLVLDREFGVHGLENLLQLFPNLKLNYYRGLFVGLMDRLPALRTLRVSALSHAQVNENILALVESSADPDCMAHLRRLRVQPLCD